MECNEKMLVGLTRALALWLRKDAAEHSIHSNHRYRTIQPNIHGPRFLGMHYTVSRRTIWVLNDIANVDIERKQGRRLRICFFSRMWNKMMDQKISLQPSYLLEYSIKVDKYTTLHLGWEEQVMPKLFHTCHMTEFTTWKTFFISAPISSVISQYRFP